MTYKPTKFDESAVMRSLEKIAIQKGLATPDQIQKKAETKKPVAPTDSFSENLLILCEKLRERGFSKYATELEVKFLTFKKAETNLYDITKETGEDLVDSAHPEGGKKLDSTWNDLGEIETITEQHSKILDVINKMPKGKLANKNAINAIKIVMSQHMAGGSTEEEQRNDLARKYLADANKILDTITEVVNREGGLWNAGISSTILFTRGKWFNTKVTEAKSLLTKNEPTIDDVTALTKLINNVYSEISPGITGGVSENTWQVISPMFRDFSDPLNKALDQIKQRNVLRTQRLGGKTPAPQAKTEEQGGNVINMPEVTDVASFTITKFKTRVDTAFNKLQSFTSVRNVAQNPTAIKWVKDEAEDLKELYSRLEAVDPDQAEAVAQALEAEIAEEEANINDFYDYYVKPKAGA